MKLFSLALLFAFCLSCSSPKNESNQTADAPKVDEIATSENESEGDGDMSGGSIMYQSQKNDLDAFMAEFNGLKNASAKIVFEASYDLGGFARPGHVVDGKLRFFHSYESGEGGFGHERSFEWRVVGQLGSFAGSSHRVCSPC